MTPSTDQQSARHEPAAASSRLLSIQEAIMKHWEREVRARVDGADALHGLALTQALPLLFEDIAMDLASDAPMRNLRDANGIDSAADHGMERPRHTAFGPEQVGHEFQIFRESIAAVAEGNVDIDTPQ